MRLKGKEIPVPYHGQLLQLLQDQEAAGLSLESELDAPPWGGLGG